MKILPLKTRVLIAKFNLLKTLKDVLSKNRAHLQEKDILILSSKIVALSQGRIVNLRKVKPGALAIALSKKVTHYGRGREDPRVIELTLREADVLLPGKMLLALKNGILIPSAGIDLSNAPAEHAILWPEKPRETAAKIRDELTDKRQTDASKGKIKKLGVIICDSFCQPLRAGTSGVALAWAGFEGVEDCRGKHDLFGKKLAVTRKAVADNLCSAALLVMGETNEKIPFAIVRGASVKFTDRIMKKNEGCIKIEECVFGEILKMTTIHNS